MAVREIQILDKTFFVEVLAMDAAAEQVWEKELHRRANEDCQDQVGFQDSQISADRDENLARAYAHSEQLTAQHSRSFYLATTLLPKAKRQAVRALYAFCRQADDIVDEGPEPRREAFHAYRQQILSGSPSPSDPIALAWSDARARYQIPSCFAEQLLDGISRDLEPHRYHTFEELSVYCYGVASTVGLMSMHIIGFSGELAQPHAIKLGVALQMTNILRDVGEDWSQGRLYLPLEELEQFGLTPGDIAAHRQDKRWKAFMKFQIERNRRLYREAQPGIAMLNREGRLAVAAAAAFYQGILDDIEKNDYNVFTRRAHLAAGEKIRRLLPALRASLAPAISFGL
jgi:15-cis-phytoene synthase